jgi:membrane-associated protease RseP (regulator of RpoE activity)
LTWQRYGRHAVLFILTIVSVVFAGRLDGQWSSGFHLALGLIPILFCHEMGHYLACRYYDVDATLPFFIPSPWIPVAFSWAAPWLPLSFIGTFGAVIRIRSPFPNRKALFDIGIAGPLAGFAALLPVLWLGVHEARFIPLAQAQAMEGGINFAEPLLMQWAFALLRPVPAGTVTLAGPFWLAAWFGLLVTALNLMPVGQLDGGHVTHALFGSRAEKISKAVWWAAIAMILWFGPTFILWVALMRILGFRHPRAIDEYSPIGRGRALVALFGLAVFLVSFLPSPFMLNWHDAGQLVRELFTSR